MFEEKIYEPKIGSPISGFLMEFKIRPYGKKMFETFYKVPIFWLRYVDDIFFCLEVGDEFFA